jgi:hypothetical protein
MRIGLGLIAGSLIVAGAVAPSFSAPRESAKAADSVAADTALQVLAPPAAAVSTPVGGAGDGTGLKRPTKVVALTADECTTLGGEVVTDFAGICVSGAFCRTTDNTGKKHRVCLSKKQ